MTAAGCMLMHQGGHGYHPDLQPNSDSACAKNNLHLAATSLRLILGSYLPPAGGWQAMTNAAGHHCMNSTLLGGTGWVFLQYLGKLALQWMKQTTRTCLC